MFYVKLSESTAARKRVPIYLVDSGDGFTPETGVTSPTIEVSKNGGAQASGTGTFSEIGDGTYFYEFASGEIDTLGWVHVRVVKSGTSREYNAIVHVTAYDAYDGVRMGVTALPNAAAEASGGLITRGTSTGQLNVSSGNLAGSVASVAGNVGGNVNGSIGGDVSGSIGGNLAGTIGGLSTTAKSHVQAEAAAALAAINLDHLLFSAVDTNFANTVHLDSVVGYLADNGTSASFDRTTDSLEAMNNRAIQQSTTLNSIINATDSLTNVDLEVSSVPAASSTMMARVGWLFALARNRILQTATEQTLRNDDDDADIATASTSDDGTTFERGPWQ